MKRVIVLFSGGQDSTTCLYWAKQEFKEIECINFFYDQRHKIEVSAAKRIAHIAEVAYVDFNINIFSQISDSSLIQFSRDISSKHRNGKLPSSFVPGRNIIFLTTAAIWAYKLGIKDIVTGVCETDYSGYPDCRDNTIKSLQKTLSLAMEFDFTIHTPLMFLTKAETVKLAQTFPGCMEALSYSYTCYEGTRIPCGKCPACVLRRKGFKEAGVEDPLLRRLLNERSNNSRNMESFIE